MKRVKYFAAGISHIGGRARLEDNFLVLGDKPGTPVDNPELVLVADGAGGHEGGKLASELIVKAFEEMWGRKRPVQGEFDTWAQNVNEVAHTAMSQMAASKPTLQQMVSTSVVAIRSGDDICVLNIGDSRAYVLDGDRLVQLTVDHVHPYLDYVITRGVSAGYCSDGDSFRASLGSSCPFLLLCSDGLHKSLTAQEIVDELKKPGTVEEKAQRLVTMAVDKAAQVHANGGVRGDNVTVVLLERQEIPDLHLYADADMNGRYKPKPKA